MTDTVKQTAKQVDYKLKGNWKANPQYKYSRISLATSNSASVDISTASTLLDFKMPANDVYNLAKSYITYELYAPAVASKATWTYEDTLAVAENIAFENSSGDKMAYIQFVDKYIKVARKLNTKVDELLTHDTTSLLYPCNSIADNNKIPAVNPSDKGSVGYIEPQYTVNSGLATALEKYVAFPLSGITNSLFSYDKDLYFGQEMYIRINTNPLNRIVWTSTSISDPTAGVAAVVVDPANAATKVVLKNVYLFLAIEQNKTIKQEIIDTFNANAFHINVPYTVGYSKPVSSNVSNIQYGITKQYGSRLMQILHTVYDATNSLNKAYDNDNTYDAINTKQKVASYRTILGDTQYLQDRELNCGPPANGSLNNDDWYQGNKRFCDKSVIMNNDVYKRNWFHIDRFYSEDQDIENQDVGIPLPSVTLDWTFEGQTDAAAKLHYTYLTFRRGYTISSFGVVPDPIE